MKRYLRNILSVFVLKLLRLLPSGTLREISELLEDAKEKSVQADYRKRYNIHDKFRFNGREILFYGEGEISCAENSYIGDYSTVFAEKGHSVRIGKGCHLSHNVRIYSSSMLSDQPFNVTNKLCISGDVIIEDYVWVGANVFINPGVVIGKNSIVGANAVVTKNIESNSIYGGVPARKIKAKANPI